MAESARALCVRVGLGFPGWGQASLPVEEMCRVGADRAENEENERCSQRWVAPTMWTLPTISYPTARKASNSSIFAMNPDMEVMADAGSVPKSRTVMRTWVRR